jgi:hypothetical protein
MRYAVQVERVISRPIAVVRRPVTPAELSKVVPQACGLVWKTVKAAQVKDVGRHVAVYRDAGDGLLDIEVGVEVGTTFPGRDEVVGSVISAGDAATATHFGSSFIRSQNQFRIAAQAAIQPKVSSPHAGVTVRDGIAGGTDLEKVTGIGGFFFRAKDPKALALWYQEHLGVLPIPTSYGEARWQQEAGPLLSLPSRKRPTILEMPGRAGC